MVLASSLLNTKVYTLRAGGQFGEVSGILIDPHRLTVAAFWVKRPNVKKDGLLVVRDIREMSRRGIIVDEENVLAAADELPRLRESLEIDYQIPGKKVVGKQKTYGTAEDFSFRPSDFMITSILVKPGLIDRLRTSQHTFLRRQIVSIGDKVIEINDEPLTADSLAAERSARLPAQKPAAVSSSSISE